MLQKMTLFWCILNLQDIFGVQICCIRHNKNKIEKKTKNKKNNQFNIKHEAYIDVFLEPSA